MTRTRVDWSGFLPLEWLRLRLLLLVGGQWESKLPFLAANRSKSRVFENVDGIRFLTHDGGCGGIRQDSAVLGKLLTAYANHPNVGGITILSLGCQHLQSPELLEDIEKSGPGFDKPIYVFEQQQS